MKKYVTLKLILLYLCGFVMFFYPKSIFSQTKPQKTETKKIEPKKTETKESNFSKLLKNFPVITAPKKITHQDLLNATQKDLDNQLAWEFFFQKNNAFKPEETNCHPVGQFNVSDKTVGIIYVKGKNNGKGTTFYAVFMKGFHKKTGTLTSTNLMPFTTFTEDGIIMAEVEIKPKGQVAFTENNTKLQKKHTQNIQIKE